MLSAAIDSDRLVADDRELRRGGVSYTIDTLESLRADYAKQPLCLLVGADAFRGLCDWHRWRELLAYGHLVVVARPDTGADLDPRLQQLIETAATADPDTLRRQCCGRIYFQPIPLLPISSTDIRARVAVGRDISHLVPQPVQRLIDQYQLYKSPV
jgi:nicotinate-nucleotide adenylyltransferase